MQAKTIALHIPYDGSAYRLTSNDRDAVLAGTESNGGVYEPHIMKWLKDKLPTDAVCMDIGANIGAISIAMAHVAQQGTVYAFEPSGHNFHYLVHNIADNGLSRIIPVHAGAYNDNVQLAFSYIDYGGAWSHITTSQSQQGIQEVVNCVKLDDWVSNTGLRRLDCLKIDVEGAEIKVLQGAVDLIKRFRPHLIIEFNPDAHQGIFGEDPKLLYDVLSQMFFHLTVIDLSGALIPIHSYNDILNILSDGRQLVDIWCSFDK
ncbi:FkbM family methyltransferase [Paenibacillus sp. 481]|uniref:FkbM family methyltransferase n=1 Tax=Paenibacillus sp. 481 TaxID=2835869 RepID=UPI001E35DC49|nr:FkbM family methyltransferase [Paenibacillus sp. 481]UHA72286.1 FkbM family methyltransferase [Paenibacillus sp. 481]